MVNLRVGGRRKSQRRDEENARGFEPVFTDCRRSTRTGPAAETVPKKEPGDKGGQPVIRTSRGDSLISQAKEGAPGRKVSR